MDKFSEVLRSIIEERLVAGRLSVAGMPGVAGRVIAALESDDTSIDEIVGLVELDPVISAALVAEASRAINGNPVASVRAAAMRLGMMRIMRVVVEVSVHKLFQVDDSSVAKDFADIWRHSVATAHLSREVARAVKVDLEVSYLAGLLHDIGKVVVGECLLSSEKQLSTFSDWRSCWLSTVNTLHQPVGSQFVEAWKLPPQISLAVNIDEDFEPSDPKSITNIVRFANAHAKELGYAAEPHDEETVAALTGVGKMLLGLDDDAVAALSHDLDAYVRNATG